MPVLHGSLGAHVGDKRNLLSMYDNGVHEAAQGTRKRDGEDEARAAPGREALRYSEQ